MPYINHIASSEQMPDMEHRSTVWNTFETEEYFLLGYYKISTMDHDMTDKEKKRHAFPSYKTEEEFMADPI